MIMLVFQEIHILQNKKEEYHEMEQEREEAIHRLQVDLHTEEGAFGKTFA